MNLVDLDRCVSADGSEVFRRVFADEAVFGLERDYIFGTSWLYLCHESQLINAGDFITTYMADTPIIVARGEDNKIHASVNSCSHRGLPVCRSDSGNAKRFVCPYHSWSYAVSGELVTIPQERHTCNGRERASLGLKAVPRLESYRGLIFGSFNEGIESLEDYLGDMRFYLDSYFNRFPQGVEVLGEPHKWRLRANWKLPVENQLGDVAHGPYLHATLLADSPAVPEIDNYGYSCVPRPGHGAAVRLMPEDAAPQDIAWGLEGMAALSGNQEFMSYLLEVQAKAAEQIGPVGARIKGLTYGVYPNLSFLWSNSTLRVSHPRGAKEVEYWSWWVVPSDAPDSVKQLLRTNFTHMFGPGGLLEQEDSESWMQQLKGSDISYMEDRPLYYGLGLGEEGEHPDLPGLVGSSYNEHYAREFYKRWRTDIDSGMAKKMGRVRKGAA